MGILSSVTVAMTAQLVQKLKLQRGPKLSSSPSTPPPKSRSNSILLQDKLTFQLTLTSDLEGKLMNHNFISQIFAYLLISALSAAIPITNRMREGADNMFTDASVAAISMAFFAFTFIAISAMISGYKHSRQQYIQILITCCNRIFYQHIFLFLFFSSID